ncbi:hypothetical protein WJX84_006120 [Apatococcus fuscideae]|uniref:Uncharacterized protein n=1 Tax=Apatococcus fuscideae TaxID=2026836 RepID=A0AAW1TG36_9CHLO
MKWAWQCDHRGQLWVHSTSQRPTPEEIQELEAFYRRVYSLEDKVPTFPKNYPTGALVGCVDVVDIVQAEEIEAWEGLPASIKEEVGSPYGFLCENARYLVVPQAMRGHPKLWHVQGNIVKGVSPALRPAKPVGAQPFSWHQTAQYHGLLPERQQGHASQQRMQPGVTQFPTSPVPPQQPLRHSPAREPMNLPLRAEVQPLRPASAGHDEPPPVVHQAGSDSGLPCSFHSNSLPNHQPSRNASTPLQHLLGQSYPQAGEPSPSSDHSSLNTHSQSYDSNPFQHAPRHDSPLHWTITEESSAPHQAMAGKASGLAHSQHWLPYTDHRAAHSPPSFPGQPWQGPVAARQPLDVQTSSNQPEEQRQSSASRSGYSNAGRSGAEQRPSGPLQSHPDSSFSMAAFFPPEALSPPEHAVRPRGIRIRPIPSQAAQFMQAASQVHTDPRGLSPERLN